MICIEKFAPTWIANTAKFVDRDTSVSAPFHW
jgi:hypothetical protein